MSRAAAGRGRARAEEIVGRGRERSVGRAALPARRARDSAPRTGAGFAALRRPDCSRRSARSGVSAAAAAIATDVLSFCTASDRAVRSTRSRVATGPGATMSATGDRAADGLPSAPRCTASDRDPRRVRTQRPGARHAGASDRRASRFASATQARTPQSDLLDRTAATRQGDRSRRPRADVDHGWTISRQLMRLPWNGGGETGSVSSVLGGHRWCAAR